MQAHPIHTGRQFGLDWLRIGAFGVLILYHIGMFFVPWGWHVKTAVPVDWVQWPMMAVNPWRLSLLFVISGVVSRALLGKLAGPGAFAASRSWRLLVPLVAGMALFVAPQPWVELRDQGRISGSFMSFWLGRYFEFGDSLGLVLPTWNHLWFVVYLWVYSMVLAAAACLPRSVRARLQQGFDGLFGSWRLLVLPVVWVFATRALLFPVYGETHALLDDPYAHGLYGFAFAFGYGLAKSAPAWAAIDRHWKTFLCLAAGAGGVMLGLHGAELGTMGAELVETGARATLAWTAILGLLGLARAQLHHDGPARRYLSEAIFPFYIVHQTLIVVVGYGLKQMQVGPVAEFGAIFLATALGCLATFEIGRRVPFLRPLLGLKTASPAKGQG
ncbi:MAG: acyltransferase family protein [Brevundimonas sp.]